MTVIIGVNLSDKIYLAGDSRLSYEQNGEVYIRHDNMQKVENIPRSKNITMASAGDAKFSQTVITRLSKEAFIKSSINDFRNNIEAWFRLFADEYFTQVGYTEATFLFAGSDQDSKKKVSGKRLIEMANAYTGGKGIIRMNSALRSAINEGKKIAQGERELNVPDIRLFSVRVNRKGIKITDTQWGAFLIYGPEGLVKDDIQMKDIASFEFNPTMLDNGSGAGNDQALINAFIYTQAEKYNLSTVGGSVVPFSNNADGTTTFITGKTMMIPLAKLETLKPGESARAETLNTILVSGDRIYREVNGTRHKLILVSEYKPREKGKFLL